MKNDSRGYRDGYFSRDGLRLHYRDYPGPNDGPPLLCLHGLTRNARDFTTFAESWSPRYRVLCLDFRGRGESDYDPIPQRYVPPTYAHDVIALLDHVGVADAVFVGTSLGGIVAMLVAVLDEDRIAATILNDVGPELTDEGLARIRTYVGANARFTSWADAANRVKANQRGLPASWGEAEWERQARRLCRQQPDGSIHFDYDPAIAVPFGTSTTQVVDMWPLFDALTRNPVLAVRGQHSDLLTPAALDAMARRGPNVTTVTISGVGHAPELIEPDAVRSIRAFLDRAGSASR